MGGIRSFFIESKLFQLVVEEGGNFFALRIFERGKYFMKSVFMGKNAALWLMKSIEHMVIGVNPKQFFTLREGDTAYTLQWGSNSFGQFLLVSELKAGGLRRSVIIPEGKGRHGWKVFGLELRKMLEPSQYALGHSGHAKLIPQTQKRNSVVHPSRSFAETVKGPVQAKDNIQSIHNTKDAGQNIIDGAVGEKQQDRTKETMVVALEQFRNQVVDVPVVQPGTAAVRGGEGRERSINLDINLGAKLSMQNKRRSPLSFSLNSNGIEKGKGRDLRESRWFGKGLIVEVAENGKRRVYWDNSKGGKSSFKWVIRAVTEQKEEVGISLGPKHTEAHCVSNSSPMSTSPCHLEAGECSNSFLNPDPSTFYPDGLEENITVSPSGLMAPVEMRSENDGSFSVSQLHVASPATVMQTEVYVAVSLE
ncbi:hypothetical protein SO802_011225 [Lithocarpus litseifolius]|uniref:Uncharacterized protein n=1 Tax=Lithocarpus litseifolius TaxID=425828 RepID=A0AAW2D0Q9_9ROSI